MTKSRRIVGAVLLVGVLYFAARGAYYVLTYVDESITTGEAYGLRIGDTKESTFERLGRQFEDETVWIASPSDRYSVVADRDVKFSLEEFNAIESQDHWQFYLNRSMLDSIRLAFTNDKLAEIYRHRQRFELP